MKSKAGFVRGVEVLVRLPRCYTGVASAWRAAQVRQRSAVLIFRDGGP